MTDFASMIQPVSFQKVRLLVFISCSLSLVLYLLFFISCSLYLVLYLLFFISCSLYLVLYLLFFISCSLSLVLYLLFFVSCSLSLVLYLLFFISCSLSLVLYLLFFISCSLSLVLYLFAFPFVGVWPVISHSSVPLLYLLFSIAPCCWPFLHFSSFSAFLRFIFRQSSHLSCLYLVLIIGNRCFNNYELIARTDLLAHSFSLY